MCDSKGQQAYRPGAQPDGRPPGRRSNFWVLIGTASTWFLLDIAFYSQNLFLPNILEGIGYNPSIKLPISSAPCAKTHSCTTFDQQARPLAAGALSRVSIAADLPRLEGGVCNLCLAWLPAVHDHAGRKG